MLNMKIHALSGIFDATRSWKTTL